MMRKVVLFALPLALASVPVSATESAAVDAAIVNLYAPYTTEEPDWDAVRAQSNYSAETAALIVQWEQSLPPDEVTDLADFDWLCECQDWDSSEFKVEIAPHGEPAGDRIDVTTQISVGFGPGWDPTEKRFALIREGGVWKVDDMFSDVFPKGLKVALREAIANPQAE